MNTLTERRLWIWVVCLALLLTPALSLSAQDETADGDDAVRTLSHDDREREYLLHVPETYTGEDAVPLALVFHGAGDNATNMRNATEFRELADLTGTIVAYPNAVDARWDYLDVPLERGDDLVNEIGFVEALIDALSEEFNVDQNRIYTIGYSNGGLMAFRARCSLDDRIAATGLIGTSITYSLAQLCIGSAPVATTVAIGTGDQAFPLNGYAEIDDGILYSAFSHPMTFTYLTTLNQCVLTTERFEEVTASVSPNRVIVQEPAGCPDDDLVRFYSISEAGHEWPTALVQLPGGLNNIPGAVWDFVHERSLESEETVE